MILSVCVSRAASNWSKLTLETGWLLKAKLDMPLASSHVSFQLIYSCWMITATTNRKSNRTSAKPIAGILTADNWGNGPTQSAALFSQIPVQYKQRLWIYDTLNAQVENNCVTKKLRTKYTTATYTCTCIFLCLTAPMSKWIIIQP